MRRLLIGILAVAATACSDSGSSPVPRRTAYPRIAEYAADYAVAEGGAVVFDINSSAGTPQWHDGALTISYPRYNATVYCSAVTVDASGARDAIANRMERFSLNLNGARPQTTESVNAHGFRTLLLKAPSATSTPLQFIAFPDEQPDIIVSGTAFFADATAATDSLAPMVAVIERDLAHALTNLRRR